MLIRFVINNIFSFGEEKEFNMLPTPRFRRLNHHKYEFNSIEILKMSSIYGANGAGKSNLIQALLMLQMLVEEEKVSTNQKNSEFKFKKDNEENPQVFVIEFFQDGVTFIYGVEIFRGVIKTEELYLSGQGIKEDSLVFERKTDIESGKTTINSPALEKDEESKILKKVIEKNLSKPDKIILKLLTTLDNPHLGDVSTAFKWFDDTLQIVTPDAKPSALVYKIDTDTEFKHYAEDIMRSFHLGIEGLSCQKKILKEFFSENNKNDLIALEEELNKSEKGVISLRSRGGHELILMKEGSENFVKSLQIEHRGKNNTKAMFNLNEESDGTIRLLDLIPAFQNIVQKNKVFVIDEVERSIHPLLIKELVRKFSEDNSSNGQLIFTTHESNLLDQDIFRQDEIWFAEKNKDGCTDLYSLSDFKEHNSIDIRKGYLTGRYGSIPFLANLKDLNWQEYAIKE